MYRHRGNRDRLGDVMSCTDMENVAAKQTSGVERWCEAYVLYQLFSCRNGEVRGVCETNNNHGSTRPGIIERWPVKYPSVASMRSQIRPSTDGSLDAIFIVHLDGVELLAD